MNFHDLRIIVGQIKKNIQCPRCKKTYTDEDIEVIGSLGDEHNFFHASCLSCEMESVIHVSIQFEDPIQLVQNMQRLGTAPRMGQISSDDILDMRNFLDDFQGDFSQMFQPSSSSS